MHLSFPNGERDEVRLCQHSHTVGSGQTDDIHIAHDSVTASHVILLLDQRGIVLLVTQANSAAVNDRPIASKAILRPGDSIRLGEVEALLCSSKSADLSDEERSGQPTDAGQDEHGSGFPSGFPGGGPGDIPGLFSFRAISGGDNGQLVAVPAVAPDKLDLAVLKAGLVSLQADDDVVVNGNRVRSGLLRPGDQLVVDQQRWLLEAASFVPGRDYVGQQPDKPDAYHTEDDSATVPRQRNELMVVGGTLVLAVACLVFLLVR